MGLRLHSLTLMRRPSVACERRVICEVLLAGSLSLVSGLSGAICVNSSWEVVLTHLVCQQLLESGVDACQQLKKVVLKHVCQQRVNVETRALPPILNHAQSPPAPTHHLRPRNTPTHTSSDLTSTDIAIVLLLSLLLVLLLLLLLL